MAFATSSITGAFASFIYFVCRAGSIYEERSTGLQGSLCRTSSRFSRMPGFQIDRANDFFMRSSRGERLFRQIFRHYVAHPTPKNRSTAFSRGYALTPLRGCFLLREWFVISREASRNHNSDSPLLHLNSVI